MNIDYLIYYTEASGGILANPATRQGLSDYDQARVTLIMAALNKVQVEPLFTASP